MKEAPMIIRRIDNTTIQAKSPLAILFTPLCNTLLEYVEWNNLYKCYAHINRKCT